MFALCYLLVSPAVTHAIPSDTRAIASSTFQTTTDKEVSLRDFRGFTIVLHFMGSWCGECILEAPSLNTLSRAVKQDGVVVIGVAIKDTPKAMAALVERLQIPYPVLIDRFDQLKSFFEVRGVPVTYILGPDGDVIEFRNPETGRMTPRIQGPQQWDTPAALRAVRDAAHAASSPALGELLATGKH